MPRAGEGQAARARLAGPGDMAAVRDLCRAYRDVLIARSRDVPAFVETYYGAEAFERLLEDLPRLHAPPEGAVFVAEARDRVVGCAMIHRVAPGVAEIKRVYVDPDARGTGAGRLLFEAAMAEARGRGYARMVLDTFHTLTEAIALYGKLGFEPIPPFYDPDPDLLPYLRFYGRAL